MGSRSKQETGLRCILTQYSYFDSIIALCSETHQLLGNWAECFLVCISSLLLSFVLALKRFFANKLALAN